MEKMKNSKVYGLGKITVITFIFGVSRSIL